jgi:hypothetical protein
VLKNDHWGNIPPGGIPPSFTFGNGTIGGRVGSVMIRAISGMLLATKQSEFFEYSRGNINKLK